MNKLVLILSLACCLVLVNCSGPGEKNYIIQEVDGLKVYKNMDRPSVKELIISVKKAFELRFDDETVNQPGRNIVWPRFLDLDSDGNIYIVDIGTTSVKKFSANGSFIKSFGKEGGGPGEMQKPYMLAVLNDIVYVVDLTRRIAKFDTNGEFIGQILIKAGLPNYFQAVGKDKFIYIRNSFEQNEQGIFLIVSLVLANSQFEEICTLSRYKAKYNPQYNIYLDRFTPYTLGKNEIFVAENSTDKYKINVFDFNGKSRYSIEKNWSKIPFNEDELEELNASFKARRKRDGRVDLFRPFSSGYKRAINFMYYDKEGRLLVSASLRRNESNKHDFLVDVFKDGVFLEKVKLDICKGYDFIKIYDEKIFFKGNRIYHMDEPEALITVFSY